MTSPPTRRAGRMRRLGPDALGIAWVLAAAAAVMAPALAHGASLGPYDWLSSYGLSKQPGVAIHNRQTFDLVTEMIPWTNLAWTQVHHGHLPLWNPYNALGTPLAFNWQAATLSLPALVGYAVPLHLAYTVQVLTTLVVAGTGAYVLCRLLGVSVLGCVMAGTAFELSGAFFAWLGWPMASVLSWAGWLFAAALLVVRGAHRGRAVAGLAVVVALAIYAGQPDALVLLAMALVVFVVALLVQRSPGLGGPGALGRPLLDLALGGAAGGALGAPLLLPGTQLLVGSVRGAKGGSQAISVGDLLHVFFQGFDGSPAGRWFGESFYMRTAAYLGVIGVVLAALAVGVALGRRGRPRRPEVLALGAVAVASAVLVVLPPLALGSVQWHRALLPMDFALAVLAGVGVDVLWRGAGPGVRRWAAGGFGAVAGVLALVFLVGRGSLPPAEEAVRARSFIWPWAQCTLGLGVVVLLAVIARPGRAHRARRTSGAGQSRAAGRRARWAAAAVLMACETAFLVSAGTSLWSSSPRALTPTPAEVTLRSTVGTAVVGLGSDTCFTPDQIGIVPEVNAAFGVHEFAAYDPLLPHRYDTAWFAQTGQPPLLHHGSGAVPFTVFCPVVPSARVARRYGIGFILEHAGAPGPAGTVLVRHIAGEGLYRVPGAAPATEVPIPDTGVLPGLDAPGAPVAVDHPDPATWRVPTHAAAPVLVRLRLTDVPGWHATVDGRPATLQAFAGVMLQVRVPAGHHVLDVRYRPEAFSAGIDVAVLAALGLVAVPGVARLRSRRRAPGGAVSGPG